MTRKRARKVVFSGLDEPPPKVTRGSSAKYWADRVSGDLEKAGNKLTSRVLLDALRYLRWAMDDVSDELEKVIKKERRRAQ